MKIFTMLVSIICLLQYPCYVYSVDLGINGQVWPIQEIDIREIISKQLKEVTNSPINRRSVTEILNQHFNTKQNIVVTSEKTKSHYFTPSLSLNKDIIFANKVIYKKGTIINPLEYVTPLRPMLFFDGASKEQRDFAIKANAKFPHQLLLVISSSNPYPLSKELKVPIYYAYPYLIHKFKVNGLPALVNIGASQHARQLAVTEFAFPYLLSVLQNCWNGCDI